MSSKATQTQNIYRKLLKAVEKHIGKSGSKGHFRDFIIKEFRENAKLSNPSEVQQKLNLAHDYAFLLNSVHHQKVHFFIS
ncbi:hypothetical protein KSP39_PZI002778 [Platanthera zijinensis]|uniref:Complex 1 LYR protein domain-containing protein n=1 Tax=Platanthera zijinensis TaxID=2320716 RepID=A0AAP0BZJ9_9ASPA